MRLRSHLQFAAKDIVNLKCHDTKNRPLLFGTDRHGGCERLRAGPHNSNGLLRPCPRSLCSVSAPGASRWKEVLDLPNLPCVVAEDVCRVADEFERRRL